MNAYDFDYNLQALDIRPTAIGPQLKMGGKLEPDIIEFGPGNGRSERE